MRKHYIDYLRVIAIIAVITIHVTVDFYTKFGEIDNIGWWMSNLFNVASWFCVPLFVMISGTVILGKSIPIIEFYKKKYTRLLPPLIFWNLLFISFNIYKGIDINNLVWSLKIGYFAKGYTAVHLWYLSMFICLMLIAPFINQFLNGEKPTSNDLFILLTVMFFFFFLNGISIFSKEVLSINITWFKTFPWFIAYFIGGFYLDSYADRIRIKNIILLLLITIIILLGSALNYFSITSLGITKDYFVLNNYSPLVFVYSALIFLVVKKNSYCLKYNMIISKISEASFGMYLIHPIYILLLKNAFPSYYSIPIKYIPLSIILTTLASFFSISILRKSHFIRKVC